MLTVIIPSNNNPVGSLEIITEYNSDKRDRPTSCQINHCIQLV